jgi:hypothetical protein
MSESWGNSFAQDSPKSNKRHSKNYKSISKNILEESLRITKDDVMKELEEFVKPRRNKKGANYMEGDDVYDLCD